MPIHSHEKAEENGLGYFGDAGKKLFGSSVRTRRKMLGITQENLAERTGLHRTYVCDIERGQRNVSLENILILAAALEVPVVTLFAPFVTKAIEGAKSDSDKSLPLGMHL